MENVNESFKNKVKQKITSTSVYPSKFDVLNDSKSQNPIISIHCKDSFDGGHIGISRTDNGMYVMIVEHDRLNKTIVRQALKKLSAQTGVEYEVEFARCSTKGQKHENYEWVREIILSCSNEGQFDIALNVITQFDKIYKDKTYFDSLMTLWRQEEMRLNENVLKRRYQKIVSEHGEMKLNELSNANSISPN